MNPKAATAPDSGYDILGKYVRSVRKLNQNDVAASLGRAAAALRSIADPDIRSAGNGKQPR